jgi:ABC-type branched-subunit amino acid transport system substrate-binding protein
LIRPTRAWRAAAVLATATLVLTACGGETDDNNDAGNETTTESPDAAESPAAQGDGVLNIGALLPQTGDLAFLGPPEFAGVDLAIQEINDAGGVFDQEVGSFKADSGDGTPDIAGASVDNLLNDNVDVIIGAAASGVSLSVIDKITGAGVVQFSPANTSPAFDTYDDGGMYFRTAPSDVLQGEVLGNLAIEDGFTNIAIMARQDSYGEGLAKRAREIIEEKGASVPEYILYSADAQNFTAEVNKVASAQPDALVLIGFEETTKIVPQLISKGVGPQDIQLYFVDGNMADYSDQNFNLEGVKGTFPAPGEVDESFNDRLLEIDPSLTDFTYGPQSYDAVIMSALAAIAAGDDSGEAIASELINISKDGEKCTTFEECRDLLEAGEDIDYDGVSGPCDLNDTGSPNKATIGIQEYGQDNKYTQIDSVSGVIN